MSQHLPAVVDGEIVEVQAPHPLAALNDFYRAFNRRDLHAMERNWWQHAEASMSNPLGGIARGWPAIRAIYARIFGGTARVQVAFHDFTLHEAGDAFHVVGRERGTLVNGQARRELAIRTTRLFRRIDGAWRQVHHHGSFEDAALLAAYQEAVR